MNARNEALLEKAKQQGYLVMPYGHNGKVYGEYFRWCKANILPAIIVTYHGQSAFLETNTDPVHDGYFRYTDKILLHNPDFTPTPELKAQLEAMSKKLLASASHGNRGRARTLLTDKIHARYVGQEAAIEAAKELVGMWQEAKKHIQFEVA